MNEAKLQGLARTVVPTILALFFAATAAYATLQLLLGISPSLSWLGLAIAAGSPLAGFLLHKKNGSSGERPALFFTALSGLGLAICMTMSWRYENAAGQVHIWAGLAFIAWFLYVRYFSANQ